MKYGFNQQKLCTTMKGGTLNDVNTESTPFSLEQNLNYESSDWEGTVGTGKETKVARENSYVAVDRGTVIINKYK